MQSVTIDVTEQDIATAIAARSANPKDFYSPYECPIANAATRVFGLPARCGVKTVSSKDETTPLYKLTDVARTFVYAFDDHEEVAPFTFVATADDEPVGA